MSQLLPILIASTGIMDSQQVDAIGGAHIHTLHLYKELVKKGLNVYLLISTKKPCPKLEQLAQSYGLAYEKIYHAGLLKNRLLFKIYLTFKLISLCKKIGPCIVQCNSKAEIWAANIAKQFTPIKIVFTRHTPQIISHRRIRGVLGALGSGHQTTAMLHAQNKKIKNSIKLIDNLPMFFNQDKFLNYQATEDRTTFFSKNFGLSIPATAPLLCMVANLYIDVNHKNHPLLLNALAQINSHRREKVHLILAGGGPAEQRLKQLATSLGIAAEVHFLGFTDQTPGILYHTDIFVLSSKEEAFGIAYLEAALMKKPLVGATNTGAENVIIIHEKTGLLFKNNDCADLVKQLELLIDDTVLRENLGKNAFKHVMATFAHEVGAQKLIAFYHKIAAL